MMSGVRRRVWDKVWWLLDDAAGWAWLPVLWLGLTMLPAWPGARRVWQFSADEGLNMMKARLLADGVPLYGAVWNDQPPLYTHYLAGLVKLSDVLVPGQPVVALWLARLTSLALIALSAGLIYKLARRHVGIPAAAVGAAGLWAGYFVTMMSGTVLIGTPAVALALLAAWATVRATERQPLAWAAGAGLLLATSLLCKMLMVPLVVALPLWLVLRKQFAAAGVLSGVGLLAFGLIGWLSGFFGGITQMAGAGLSQQTRDGFADRDVLAFFLRFGIRQWATIILAGLGIGWAWQRRVPAAGLAVMWLAVMGGLLALHRPLWYHHLLVLIVPLAWLGAYGAEAVMQRVGRYAKPLITRPAVHRRTVWHVDGDSRRMRRTKRVSTVEILNLTTARTTLSTAVALALVVLLTVGPMRRSRYVFGEVRGEQLFTQIIDPLREAPGKAVFADQLLYAYLADRRVPPTLAVMSSKRLRSGMIDSAEVIAALEEADVRVMHLARFDFEKRLPAFKAWIEAEFEPVPVEGADGVHPLGLPNPLRDEVLHVRRGVP